MNAIVFQPKFTPLPRAMQIDRVSSTLSLVGFDGTFEIFCGLTTKTPKFGFRCVRSFTNINKYFAIAKSTEHYNGKISNKRRKFIHLCHFADMMLFHRSRVDSFRNITIAATDDKENISSRKNDSWRLIINENRKPVNIEMMNFEQIELIKWLYVLKVSTSKYSGAEVVCQQTPFQCVHQLIHLERFELFTIRKSEI